MHDELMRQEDRLAQNAIAEAYGLETPYPEPVKPLSKSRAARMEELELVRSEQQERKSRVDTLCEEIANLKCGVGAGMKIARAVAKAHGISWTEFTSLRRHRHVVYARHHAMWEIKQHTNLSLPQIAQILGKRDHTTVVWGLRQHQKRMDSGEFSMGMDQ